MATFATAQRVTIKGRVTDENHRPIEIANVSVVGGLAGTTADLRGNYTLTCESKDSLVIAYSMIGYQTRKRTLHNPRGKVRLNVVLPASDYALEGVTIREMHRQTGQNVRIQSEQAKLMPTATGNAVEELIATQAGVSSHNELSSQYNVRGGSFDENSVYVNGIEIYRPLLVRSGQQEGLSFINPDMVESIQFSSGGFEAKYGDKMSSVLDIQYKRPTQLESRLSMSLLGASGYVGWGDSTHSQMHGIRYKTSRYLLGTMDTKGEYKPNFVDYQTQMTWHLGDRAPQKSTDFSGTPQAMRRWDITLLGNFSQNSYIFAPDSNRTAEGTMQQSIKKDIWFEGQEEDMFRTAFAALNISHQPNRHIRLNLDLSGYYTHETETFDIRSEYVLSEKPLDTSEEGKQQENGNTMGETVTDGNLKNEGVLGTGVFHEHARNTLQAGMVTLAHSGAWKSGENNLQWGVSGQMELINDRISEWEWRDSMGYSMPNLDNEMALYYALKGTSSMLNTRVQAYVQDSYRWQTSKGDVLLTGGVRLNWWSFTNEILPSPRLSVTWMPGWKRDFTFRVATGLYYQAPFYKELRQVVQDEGAVNRIYLNNQLRAQRSWQLVLGADYYFRAWGRPFKFTAEAYGKLIDRMESYTVDNVRVRYSGINDSEGYTLGLDVKLMGELVPGADSWISFSTMRSRMHFIDDTHQLGWIPTPQEQRYNLTLYFQDYIPQLPQYKVHLKFIYSEGMPYGYPRNEKLRYMGHMQDYQRVDIGASRVFSAATDKWMKKAKHVDSWSVQLEVFNLIGQPNVNSYYWTTDAKGQQWRTKNTLTGRMFNLKFDVMIK